jgi:hypothetical protein
MEAKVTITNKFDNCKIKQNHNGIGDNNYSIQQTKSASWYELVGFWYGAIFAGTASILGAWWFAWDKWGIWFFWF